MKACKTKQNKPKNETRLSSNPTPRSKKNRIKEKHKKGGHMFRSLIFAKNQ